MGRAIKFFPSIVFYVIFIWSCSDKYNFGESRTKKVKNSALIQSCFAFHHHVNPNDKYRNRYRYDPRLSSSTTITISSSTLYDRSNLVDHLQREEAEDESALLPDRSNTIRSQSTTPNRRDFIFTMTAISVFLPIRSSTQAFDKTIPTNDKSLEDLQFASGRWNSSRAISRVDDPIPVIPSYFTTYLTRFLINYDEGVVAWWQQLKQSYLLISDEEKKNRLGRDFGSLAFSLQQALELFLQNAPSIRQGYEQIFDRFVAVYVKNNDSINNEEVSRQLSLLAATLPIDQQPRDAIQKLISISYKQREDITSSSSDSMTEDLSMLLPTEYKCVLSKPDGYLEIQPHIGLYEIGVGKEFGQAATATTFGPLATLNLKRDLPRYTFDIYALFGISGATGCALTHSIVIPLDVIKTRAQTSTESYSKIVTDILQKEGPSGLLTGAQATLAGYAWYGISVYPCYAFFKRFLGHTLSADVAIAHANDIVLIAGALAAVIASLGLTPLEAARIRVVTDPERYRSLGLMGTLQESSLKSLYKGLPSLMTRQVIFGSIKFLAFERACEAIYFVWPMLRDTTWTALSVSLVAGGFSGALSCFVSQPADAVLTYVAQEDNQGHISVDDSDENNTNGLGVLEGSMLMIKENGVSSLFRGLGSRTLWAASIISGQFFLYDIFRNIFNVNSEDLSQIFKVNL